MVAVLPVMFNFFGAFLFLFVKSENGGVLNF